MPIATVSIFQPIRSFYSTHSLFEIRLDCCFDVPTKLLNHIISNIAQKNSPSCHYCSVSTNYTLTSKTKIHILPRACINGHMQALMTTCKYYWLHASINGHGKGG